MQRDMGLIRQILFKMEEHPGGFAPADFAFDGYSATQIGYHIWLLGEAGLMRVTDVTTLDDNSPQAMAVSLKWEGHDFIDAARSDTTWSRAMEKAKTAGVSLSFAVLRQLLDSVLRGQLGISGGGYLLDSGSPNL